MNHELTQAQHRSGPSMPALFDTTGKRIRMLRTGHELSQLDLAKLLEAHGVQVGNSFISQVETSGKQPPLEMVVALAKVLGTTTDFLLMVSNDPLPDDTAKESVNV